MQECDKYGNVLDGSVAKDLEADFSGLRYSMCNGINKKGKIKNIYTETYSDSDTLRTYVPPVLYREYTEIEFTFYIFGNAEERQNTFDKFIAYLSNGYHLYWDTARKRKFVFLPPEDEITPSDESWYAGKPYFKVEIKVKNIKGSTEKID